MRKMLKCTALHVTVRRMATGCDYSKTLFLHSVNDAFATMAKHARYIDRHVTKEGLRLIEVTPLAITQAEYAAKRSDAEAYTCADCGYHGFGGWNCNNCGAHSLIRS
jgi:hypothetical protein